MLQATLLYFIEGLCKWGQWGSLLHGTNRLPLAYWYRITHFRRAAAPPYVLRGRVWLVWDCIGLSKLNWLPNLQLSWPSSASNNIVTVKICGIAYVNLLSRHDFHHHRVISLLYHWLKLPCRLLDLVRIQLHLVPNVCTARQKKGALQPHFWHIQTFFCKNWALPSSSGQKAEPTYFQKNACIVVNEKSGDIEIPFSWWAFMLTEWAEVMVEDGDAICHSHAFLLYHVKATPFD